MRHISAPEGDGQRQTGQDWTDAIHGIGNDHGEIGLHGPEGWFGPTANGGTSIFSDWIGENMRDLPAKHAGGGHLDNKDYDSSGLPKDLPGLNVRPGSGHRGAPFAGLY